jgi:hypothetical protein
MNCGLNFIYIYGYEEGFTMHKAKVCCCKMRTTWKNQDHQDQGLR